MGKTFGFTNCDACRYSDSPLQFTDLILCQIIFPDFGIGLENPAIRSVFVGFHSHQGFFRISILINNFRRGVASDGVVKFILHVRVKLPGRL